MKYKYQYPNLLLDSKFIQVKKILIDETGTRSVNYEGLNSHGIQGENIINQR